MNNLTQFSHAEGTRHVTLVRLQHSHLRDGLFGNGCPTSSVCLVLPPLLSRVLSWNPSVKLAVWTEKNWLW